MTTTINISLPTEMYKDVKVLMANRGYASISELVRDALRRTIYLSEDEITENGFPKWFEDKVLKAAEEPFDKSRTIETDEDLENYFKEMHSKIKQVRRDGKN